MFTALVIKEFHQNLLNFRFAVVCFVTTTLMVGSAAVNVSTWLTLNREYMLNRDLNERVLRNSGNEWGGFPAHVVRKPPLLALFASGGERDAETQGLIDERMLPQLYTSFKRSVIGNLYLPTDLTFIVGVVMGLLVILLSFDAVSGERERGTLKLLLASPVPRDTVILAKWTGGLLSLLLPMGISYVAIMAILALVPDLGIDSGTWIRILSMGLLYGVYVAVVFSMSLTVSVLFRASGTSALCLLLVWLVAALLLPGIAGQVAHVLAGPPGVHTEFVGAHRVVPEQFVRVGERRELDSLSYRELVGVSWSEPHTEKQRVLSNRFFTKSETEGLSAIVEKLVGISQRMLRAEGEVERVTRMVLYLSPFGCLQDACESLCATGFARETALRESYAAYLRSTWKARSESWDAKRRIGELLPSYAPPPERLAAVLLDAVLATGILCIMGLLFFMVAYRSFIRMDIT